MSAVWSVQLTHAAGWPTWNVLCDPHIAARRAETDERGAPRWAGIDRLRAVEIGCADCETERQTAPGYRTPTVVAVLLAGTVGA